MMTKRMLMVFSLAIQLNAIFGFAQSQGRQATIHSFTPQGTVKGVRQVIARFSEPMVPLGDPREPISPFDVTCSGKGAGRWVDAEIWSYDFEKDLPSGVNCSFKLKDQIRTLSGNEIGGKKNFEFSTGGPSIITSYPREGNEEISEDQIFIVELDGPAVESSVLKNVSFSIQGLSNLIGIRIVAGAEREAIIKARKNRYADYEEDDDERKPSNNLILIQAKQIFPATSEIKLIWGKGVSSPSGVASDQAQTLAFKTNGPFEAHFECGRENPEAHCVPVSAMKVNFSSPVPWKSIKNAILKNSAGKTWKAHTSEDVSKDENQSVNAISFSPPFPERSSFKLALPPNLTDDAGRKLTNANKFPLEVRTDDYPPLAKFAADFGILELNADPLLPVTLRNVESELSGGMLQLQTINDAETVGEIKGKTLKIQSGDVNDILSWIQRVKHHNYDDRDKSIFQSKNSTQPLKIPKPNGAKAFEVIGIPFTSPGFYVVEIESKLLGSALLGKPETMFVPTTVLVTNLAVHFKWGAESSIAWVTTLDNGTPVQKAAVEAHDSCGKLLWKGTTDSNGIARMDSLPHQNETDHCSDGEFSYGIVVTARLGEDMSFVHSSWQRGIEAWRFNLPEEWRHDFIAAHTILDRSLFRVGDTVHMKHVIRKKMLAGFAFDAPTNLPQKAVIVHVGSNQEYELPLKWDGKETAESSWKIPQGAKLGEYEIYLLKNPPINRYDRTNSGTFRVEEFRVPLMRAIIRPPSEQLVNPTKIPLDMSISYLSGGGASNLPVKLRYRVEPRAIMEIGDFDGFAFSNGAVKEGIERYGEEQKPEEQKSIKSRDLSLDRAGSVRAEIEGFPSIADPSQIMAELEFRDPNGEMQTASTRIPLWPAARLIGLQTDSWAQSKGALKVKGVVLDLNHHPIPNAQVKMDVFQRKSYSHRKRLVGGFYAYENFSETKRLSSLCEGKTDARGFIFCDKVVDASGEVLIQASTADEKGRTTVANISSWVPGEDEWWFEARDDDRIDVIPEKRNYEPGDTARFQVRMPFRKATVLVTIEREGVGEAYVKEISGKMPTIEIPIKGNYAPNAYISVLVVRGRASDTQPTALADLGKPAYKLGICEIKVGWKAHKLEVKVNSDRPQYRVREKAKIHVAVAGPDGTPPPAGAEVALAAVDEGLLELMPNKSWQILDAMMGRRSYDVETSTAQMQVIGKRHFGMKALPQGGGGGNQPTRELFDTLLLWKGRVVLDSQGFADVEVPLNDSITSFRIVAVATSGASLFGTGATSIRSTQDLVIFSGIPPVVRAGDKVKSSFTMRNATERALDLRISAAIIGMKTQPAPQTLTIGSGESKDLSWDLLIPTGIDSLTYKIEAAAADGTKDSLSISQKVTPAVPERPMQATLAQISDALSVPIERPKDAIPGMGRIEVSMLPTLAGSLTGVSDYMRKYPYSCLEQKVSKAVALRNAWQWESIAAEMPTYIDGDGLLKYFQMQQQGSDVLTSYILAITHEAGFEIPETTKNRIIEGLKGFVEGKVARHSSLPTVDLSIRKLAAIAALSASAPVKSDLLSSISINPNLWPTSALIDWLKILKNVSSIPNREAKRKEAETILFSRLNFQGTIMNFSTEKSDHLWWLMRSPDENSVRLILSAIESSDWNMDVGRLVRGALSRLDRGSWDTTVANAWGVVAMDKFAKEFEKTPVTGSTTVSTANTTQTVKWAESPKGKALNFQWPPEKSELKIQMEGTGKPWATVVAYSAIPLKEPFSSGYRIKKSIIPIEQKKNGTWSRGDIVRVRLEIDAQSDMTWVVVNDPIPAGATILGSGLGRDSALATQGEKREWWTQPTFEERSFESFRAYYEYVPKGIRTIEYTVRLNNEGTMNMPPTRVEAMYAPEMFGELPNQAMRIE